MDTGTHEVGLHAAIFLNPNEFNLISDSECTVYMYPNRCNPIQLRVDVYDAAIPWCKM